MDRKILQSGDLSPDFSLNNQNGNAVTLSSLLHSSSVVLYFYPKDLTSGCTKEAQDFRDYYSDFQNLNCQIIGISKDSAKTHQKFIDHHCLPFPLLTDPDGKVCEMFDVWAQKSMYGRTYFGIERSTFFIDRKGIIKKSWRKVKVPGHVQEILNYIRHL